MNAGRTSYSLWQRLENGQTYYTINWEEGNAFEGLMPVANCLRIQDALNDLLCKLQPLNTSKEEGEKNE